MGRQVGHRQLLLEHSPAARHGWSPPAGSGRRTYALLRVPFGRHQALGLVQALIADVLEGLKPGGGHRGLAP